MFRIYKFVDPEDSSISDRPDYTGLDDDPAFDTGGDYGEDGPPDEDEFDVEASEEDEFGEDESEEDSDFQGIIRTVPGACLVYKRRDEKNTYEELWVYNVGGRDIQPEIKIRNTILAGTDINPKTQRSEDGQQTCETITTGNVQFLQLKGLLN